MRTTEEHIPAVVALGFPKAPAEKRAQVEARLRSELVDDPTFPHRARVLVDEGEVIAAVRAVPWYADTWYGNIDIRPDLDPARLVPLLDEWRTELAALPEPPRKVCHRQRLPLDGPDDVALLPIERGLEAAGWSALGERREFKDPLADLPAEDPDSPIVWHDLTSFGLERTLEVVADGGQGPEWEPGDDPRAIVESCLADAESYRAPDCIQVGTIDGEPVGFVIAQSEPSSGWSSVKMMGVCAAARGRGLGVPVHRHAFAMLRAQGGKTYHDGTSTANVAMIRTFERNGCTPFLRLRGWGLTLSGE